MEALGGVASGFAVASLSIQLVESVGKILTFIRNVKNAPSEFARLVELLERLHALLEDVRDLLEMQSSLQGQHFPTPSMTITKCLEGCEKSLKPLQDTIEQYERSQAQRESPMVLVKGNIKFGLKVKDIAGFETRIQQDIQYLTSALVLNNTNIAYDSLPRQYCNTSIDIRRIQAPAILNNHIQASIVANTPVCNDQIALSSKFVCRDETSLSSAPTMRYSQRMSRITSRFERFGLRKQRLVKSVYLDEEGTEESVSRHREPCLEEDKYLWAPQFLSHGISWSKRYPYGQTIFSLTVYPVVKSLYTDLPFDMKSGSVLELQRMFASNAVHPFTRDISGQSLLHVSRYSFVPNQD